MKGNSFFGVLVALVIGGFVGWWIAKPGNVMVPQQSAAGGKKEELRTAMRKLWEDHITWTRIVIYDIANDLPSATADTARLLKNATDMQTSLAMFYGDDAAAKAADLLKSHLVLAAELVKAAKANDSAALTDANTKWYDNANQIADFLSSANPVNWPQATMRAMMKEHLDLTKQEAVDTLSGKYEASVADYDAIHDQILKMSDGLTDGIVKQFPAKF